MRDLIFLSCILALLLVLGYLSDSIVDYVNAATQVYCEKRADFDKCSEEFREKTSQLMRKK